MSTMQDFEVQFFSNLATIDALRNYALGEGNSPDLGPDELEDPLRDLLATKQGRVEVGVWLASFRQSLEMLGKFRLALIGGSQDIKEDELKRVDKAASDVLDALWEQLRTVKP